MFETQHYGSFIAAKVVFQLIPGAGTISILNATARNGMGAGNAVAGKLVRWPPARRTAIRLAGVALIGFGVRLAVRN
ncbi:MAG: hypothetical protein V2J08_06695 [Desulfotignum sp.]|jgi:threonine/homoserine/homoserine lactone efflux protein|nr:hypothetical protein [Desulfotignum sp.]